MLLQGKVQTKFSSDGLKLSRNYVDKCEKAKKDENLVAKESDPARLSRILRIPAEVQKVNQALNQTTW